MGVGLLRAYVVAPCAEEKTLQDINTTAVDSCSVQRTEKLCCKMPTHCLQTLFQSPNIELNCTHRITPYHVSPREQDSKCHVRKENVGWTKPSLDSWAKPCKNEQHVGSIKFKRPTAPKISNKLIFKQCKGPQTNIPQDVGRIEDLISKPVALTLPRIGDPRQINKLSSSLLIGTLWRVRNGFILSWFPVYVPRSQSRSCYHPGRHRARFRPTGRVELIILRFYF